MSLPSPSLTSCLSLRHHHRSFCHYPFQGHGDRSAPTRLMSCCCQALWIESSFRSSSSGGYGRHFQFRGKQWTLVKLTAPNSQAVVTFTHFDVVADFRSTEAVRSICRQHQGVPHHLQRTGHGCRRSRSTVNWSVSSTGDVNCDVVTRARFEEAVLVTAPAPLDVRVDASHRDRHKVWS